MAQTWMHSLHITIVAVLAGLSPLETRAGGSEEPVGVIDYSESGNAFAIRSTAPRSFLLMLRPAAQDDLLHFAVEHAGGAGPVTLRVHGAPADATPEYTEGEFVWSPIEHVSWSGETLVLRQAFTSDHAVIRLRPPAPAPEGIEYYNLERLETHLATIGSDPNVTVEVIGWSYQNRPDVDRPIYRVTIDDATVPDDDKLPVLIFCRHHGDEFAASHIVEAMMDFIRGAYRPDLRPADLLDRMRFTIYPMINPDGVEFGDWGQRYNRNGVDLNRDWNADGSAPDEEWEVRHVHSDVEAFMQNSYYAQAVDMHGFPGGWDFAGYRFKLDEPPASVPMNYYRNQQTFFEMQEAINSYRPEAWFAENGSTVGMARYCMFVQFNVDIHTSETGDYDRTRESLLEEGPLHVLSFYEYLLNVHLTNSAGDDVDMYSLDNDRVFVTVHDLDENENAAVVDRVLIKLSSPITGDEETVELPETTINSGVFRSEEGVVLSSAPFQPGMEQNSLLQAAPGERIRVDYVDDDFAQSASWDFAVAEPSPLMLGPVTPGRAGEVNTVSVMGAAPGERVGFAYGLGLGSTPVGLCPDLVVSLRDPSLIGVAIANANGEASLSSFVPSVARGRRVFVQAVAIDECMASGVTAVRFD